MVEHMTQTTRLARSAVAGFAGFEPTDEDVVAIKEAVRRISDNPEIGTRVPFTSSGLEGVYLVRAGNWRILYTASNQSIMILSIVREDDRATK